MFVIIAMLRICLVFNKAGRWADALNIRRCS